MARSRFLPVVLTTVTPVPTPEISAVDHDDFVLEMHRRAHEEAPLWEFPLRSTVVDRDSTVHRGPWPVEACSWLLLQWLGAGLIGLYRYRPGWKEPADLTADEARQLLTAITDWPSNGSVFVFVTEDGAAAVDDAWLRRGA
jgi:hypothetical protein